MSPSIRKCRRHHVRGPTCIAILELFKVAWIYHLRGCKGFYKCTLRKESFLQDLFYGNLVTTFTSSK